MSLFEPVNKAFGFFNMTSRFRSNIRISRLATSRHCTMRLASSLRDIRNPPYRISFDEPFTLDSVTRIAHSLPHVLLGGIPPPDDPALKNDLTSKTASVLIALCNVNDVPGVLLEVRGKLRTHSGEIRSVLEFIEDC